MLERTEMIVIGEEPREIDGALYRNTTILPCGCWEGEIYRRVHAPEGYQAMHKGKEQPVTEQWCQQSGECKVHSAAFAVFQLRSSNPDTLSDGAKRLLADATHVLSEAVAVDRELEALNIEPPLGGTMNLLGPDGAKEILKLEK